MKKLMMAVMFGILINSPVSGFGQEVSTKAAVPVISGKLNKLLIKVEKAGSELRSFQAKMLFQQEQLLVETLIKRNGSLVYQTDGKTVQARIHFDDFLQQDLEDKHPAKAVKFNEDYAFDGMWVVRRNERTKSIQRWEVSKTPHNKEAFRIGKGPFPLPFAIQRADLLKHFQVELLPPDPNVARTEHIKLAPRKKSPYAREYLKLELWISNRTFLPVQISYEKDNFEVTTVRWYKPILNQKLDKKIFTLPATGPGWTVEVTPLKEPPKPTEHPATK